MILAFLESTKYVNYLLPMALLRIYLGCIFFFDALDKIQGDYLKATHLPIEIAEQISNQGPLSWYRELFFGATQYSAWPICSHLIVYCGFLIGLSFWLGFLVRPMSILGLLLCLHNIAISSPIAAELHQAYFIIFLITLWSGAGRSLGMDYFFYKRQRGWLW